MRAARLDSRWKVLSLAAVFLAACDTGWDISGTVTIPVAEQAAFEPYPAQVLLRTTKVYATDDLGVGPQTVGPFRVGILCEPGAEPARLEWIFGSIGCSVRTEVSAWMAPLELEAGQSCEDALAEQLERAEAYHYDVVKGARRAAEMPADVTFAFPDTREPYCWNSADHVELRLSSGADG